ncbi:hypothetical protein H0H81_002661 [Sphagnurus paluster]|uniref:Protein kinase domain-containing protein n=1 Tax=Sphagnurus paluster TaxID=117069 RepID=A0A9P7GLU2_9AGAR|nr:hypothetical protein H0H81_002661 [Sphagnurus paluster]
MATVVEAFTPFTMGQVLVVRTPDKTASTRLPSHSVYYITRGPQGTLALEGRAIVPHVVLLEYLPDAKTLRDVDPAVVGLPLIESLIATARAFGKLGVVPTDFNPGNILFVPGIRTHAVVIDFADSGARRDESDEEWRETVEENDDVRWMKRALERSLGVVMKYSD